MLKIFVLIKQVPKTQNLQIDKTSGTLIRENVENIINPDDLNALELGLNIKKRYKGTVTAMTMGPPQAEIALREALAMGVDHAILICDPQFAYSDTLQTTLVLREAFRKLKDYDVIITGRQTSDSSTGQVPFQLSEALDIPLITDIFSFEFQNGLFKCQRNFGHESQNIELKLPVLLRIGKHFNEPRHIPLLGIKKAFDMKIERFDYDCFNCPSEIDGCNKSPTQVVSIEKFYPKRKNQFIKGTITDKTNKIIELMKEHAIERIWTGKGTHR
ncbi:MAG: electron transfer flavoprotein subunit beta [Candidatus Lokiarchaeota archaeon]|nr:electron transfer flavoprotein subunit beta [Candidatus Lokiarchaeota archaeon]